jgi:large subunit ribosomal protein L37Ae
LGVFAYAKNSSKLATPVQIRATPFILKMARTKKVKSAGRFGARYGSYVRGKIANIESIQRKKQKCPFCKKTVVRLSKGIWQCSNCGKTFASNTYYLDKPTNL